MVLDLPSNVRLWSSGEEPKQESEDDECCVVGCERTSHHPDQHSEETAGEDPLPPESLAERRPDWIGDEITN